MTNLNRCTKTDTDTPLHSQNAVKMGVFGVKMITSIDFGIEIAEKMTC
jgi:hypothetical protein